MHVAGFQSGSINRFYRFFQIYHFYNFSHLLSRTYFTETTAIHTCGKNAAHHRGSASSRSCPRSVA